MPRGIYLDNSMTTRPSSAAVSAMMPFLSDKWGIPEAPHRGGEELMPFIGESYQALYGLLGARDIDEFVFTSSSAEAINQVILSTYLDVTLMTGKNQFITSHIDEAPAIMAIGRLERLDCVGKMAFPNKKGQITKEILSELITPRTALISLSWGNGLTGVINPIADIAALCQERGILLHVDVTHPLGKLDFNFADSGITFATFNGDHLHAPKGSGGMFIRAGVKCSPLILGGIEQGGLRAGPYNVPGFIALGHAAKEAADCQALMCTEVARLRDKLERGIVAHYPAAVPFYSDQERLPHCMAMAFPGITSEALLYALNRKGLYACMGGGLFQQIALVLTAAGVPAALAECAISFSLSRETTEEDIDKAISLISAAATQLRALSAHIEGV
jgi:cysteine desulfurase